jgi:hypothetical protein
MKSWGTSDKIAIIASIAGLLQVAALIVTVVIMIRNGRRQLEAYVLPENAGVFDGTMLDPPQPQFKDVPGVVILIKNSGQTPAYRVASRAAIAAILVKDEGDLVLPPVEDKFMLTLGSGGTFSKALRLDRALTNEEIIEIAKGQRAIYVYGRIVYQDVFKQHRYTDFRMHYVGNYPPTKGAILTFSDTGNDAE